MHHALRRRLLAPVAVLSGLLVSGLLVMHTSQAAFQASTASTGNRLGAGNVILTDNLAGTSMFAADALVPGDVGAECIDVTYRGSLDAVVRLGADYDASDPASELAQYLDFRIDQIATSSACTTAAPAVRDAFRPLDTTLKAKVDGLRAETADLGWAPAGGSNETRRYRFTYTMQDENAAQNKSAKVGFTWIARTIMPKVTAPGTFQRALGCAQNWAPDCAVPELTDPDGDNIFTWESTAIPRGTHDVKIAIGGTWGRNYGAGGVKDGANIRFTVPADGATVRFRFDSATKVLNVTVS